MAKKKKFFAATIYEPLKPCRRASVSRKLSRLASGNQLVMVFCCPRFKRRGFFLATS
jgi:hypothetical protein